MISAFTNHLWQSTLFAAAAALLSIALGRNRAKVRYWVWFSASVKFLLPFAVLLSLGRHLQPPPILERIAPEAATAIHFTEPASPSPVPSRDWIPTTVFGIWLCGFSAFALMRARGWLRIRAAVRASSPVNIPATVDVRSTPGLLEPGVVGLLKPILLLPEGIVERLTPSQLEAVLAHELCHVRRRDNLTGAIHMLVEAVFWFHPLVWWIGARLIEERERACDEAVTQLGHEPRDYADAILSVVRMYTESPLTCVAGITGSNLKRRIEEIMKARTIFDLSLAKKSILAIASLSALAAPVLLGMLGIHTVRAQSQPAAAPTVIAQAQAAPPAPPDPQPRPPAGRGGTLTPSAAPPVPPATDPPIATYQGEPAIAQRLVDELSFESVRKGGLELTGIAGLPGGHASMQTYPANSKQWLVVSMSSSLGPSFDVLAQVLARSSGAPVANLRDHINLRQPIPADPPAPARMLKYTASFTLAAGEYTCNVAVEGGSGQVYSETINFEVK